MIDKFINVMLLCQVIMMFAFSGLLVIGEYNFSRANHSWQYLFYKAFDKPGAYSLMAGKTFGSFYLLNNSFVPFDMVSMIEMVKLAVTSLFELDAEMIVVDESKFYRSNKDAALTKDMVN